MIQIKSAGSVYIILLVFITALLPDQAEPSSFPANKIKNVLFSRSKATETVTVYLNNSPSKIKPFTLHNDERLVIDIKNAFVPEVRIDKETGGRIIKKVRVSQNKKDIARIVLDIRKETLYQFDIERITNDTTNPGVKIITHILPTKATPVLLPELKQAAGTEKSDPAKRDVPEQAAPDIKASPEKQPETGAENSLVLYDDEDLPEDIFTDEVPGEKKSDFSISGLFQVRGSLDTSNEDEIENETSLRNRILLESQYRDIFTLSVLSDYLYFGPEEETDDYDLDIYEATYEYSNDLIDLSMGKQILRWGKTDRISPVDTINPVDMREFLVPEYEETKIPVWMADLTLFFNNSRLEAVFIPFFEEAEMDYFKSDWAVFPHLKEELQASSLPPSLKRYAQRIWVHEKDPHQEAEFALKFSTTIRSVDLDFSWHHSREDIPYFKSFPVKNIRVDGDFSRDSLLASLDKAVLAEEAVEVEYRKTETAGLAFETTLSDFGLRGEAAWHENQSYLTSSLTSVRRPVFEYIIGADYTTRGDMYLNLQFAHRHIYDHEPDILYFDEDTYSLLGEVSRDMLSDWLEASLYYSVTLNDRSLYISPRLEYTYITNLDLTFGANIFSGDGNTWLGRFSEDDQLFLDISYHF